MFDTLNYWIDVRYGSRRGLAYTMLHRARYIAGAYRQFEQVNWDRVSRVVFVCKGNICRSAFAEAVARKAGVNTASCGIDTSQGVPADETAVQVANGLGVDLSLHRTTRLQCGHFGEGDLFLTMEPWHADFVNDYFGGKAMIVLFGLCGQVRKPYLHDPYGRSPEYFASCFTYIKKTVYEIASKVT